jgi:hypothetical protein
MLLTNQRLDKLMASRADFDDRGMLHGSCLSDAIAILTGSHDTNSDAIPGNQGDCENSDGEGDDCGVVAGPRVLSHAHMARKTSKYLFILLYHWQTLNTTL